MSELGTAHARCWPAWAASAPAAATAVRFQRREADAQAPTDREHDHPGHARRPELPKGAADADPRLQPGRGPRQVGEEPRRDDDDRHRQALSAAHQGHAGDRHGQDGQRQGRAIGIHLESAAHGELKQPGQPDRADAGPGQPARGVLADGLLDLDLLEPPRAVRQLGVRDGQGKRPAQQGPKAYPLVQRLAAGARRSGRAPRPPSVRGPGSKARL